MRYTDLKIDKGILIFRILLILGVLVFTMSLYGIASNCEEMFAGTNLNHQRWSIFKIKGSS